jgi:hypothetical protein
MEGPCDYGNGPIGSIEVKDSQILSSMVSICSLASLSTTWSVHREKNELSCKQDGELNTENFILI